MTGRYHFAQLSAPFAVLVLGVMLAGAMPAVAQDYGDDDAALRTRIQRLERDMRDLQQEIYRDNGNANTPRPLVPQSGTVPSGDRAADMEATLQRLTGQLEELQHQNDVLSQKVDRLQRALDFQQNNAPMGAPGNDGAVQLPATEPPPRGLPAASAPPQTLAPGLAPGPSNLGSLPANTPMPLPKPPTAVGDATTAITTPAPAPTAGQRVASLPLSTAGAGGAQAEFDSAMALLRKAQYEPAQAAFRAFADAHPADAHAPDALYWTGDIAYSARHDYTSAARAFAELLKKYGKAVRAPEGMLKLGLSLLALGQKQEGCATLAALPVKYANAAPVLVARAAAERKRAACA